MDAATDAATDAAMDAATEGADAPASSDVGDTVDASPDASSDAEGGVSSCASAIVLDATNPRAEGSFTSAPVVNGCDGKPVRAFFYSVEVPVGKQLTVRASAIAGDPSWLPQLTASTGCEATTCLARGSAVGGLNQRLDWTNGGTAPRVVILAVSGDAFVVGAEFDLSIGFTDLLASCAAPIPVVDGTTLTNQTFLNVRPAPMTCGQDPFPALYYVATLLPQQELQVSLEGKIGSSFAASIGLRTSCDDGCSGGSAPRAATRNLSTTPKTVLIELTSRSNEPFDLHVSLPPPAARIAVTPTSALVTTEGGGKATFEVVLGSQPTADVTIALTSSRPGEGTPSPATLVFDATNWHRPQTVTVTGLDDQVGDGAQAYAIVTAPAVSGDAFYGGLDPDDVPLTNLDDDASLVLVGADHLVTSEDGVSATFTVRLNVAPSAPVEVPLASSNLGEGTVGPASLTFTPATWNVPQSVTLNGVDDAVVDGPRPYTIALGPLVSNDARYGGLRPPAIVVHNRDDEITAVAGKSIDAGVRCGISGTWNQFPVAVDAFGRIYAVFHCEGRLLFFTSADGGKTFSKAAAISDRIATGSYAVAASHGDTAFVVFETGGPGLALARTTDGGATWSERIITRAEPGVLRIAAARDTVVIVGENRGNDGGTTLLWSDDAGRSFRPPQPLNGEMAALSLGRDGGSIWLVDFNHILLGSHSPFGTFSAFGGIEGTDSCCYAFGTQNVLTASNNRVALAKLLNVTMTTSIAGLGGNPRAVAVDDLDVVTIFTASTVGRFGPDLKLTTSPFGVSSIDHAGALVLSRHATAFVSLSLTGQMVFSIATWP